MALERVQHFPHPMIFEQGGLCVSLYQQTHRYAPDNRQDPIVFKNLLQEIENKLESHLKKEEIQAFLKPLYELRDDKRFWNNTLDGLAIVLGAEKGLLYLLPRSVQNLALVSDSFHITPLLRAYQSADRYHLLSLNANEFKLYEGNRYELQRIQLPEDVATTITGILGEQMSAATLTHRTRSGGTTVFHGQGGRKDEMEKDLERFFRHVDTFVFEQYSKPSELPLMLVALQEHQGEFRKLSNNPFILPEGVNTSPDSMNVKELAQQAWDVLLETYLQKTKKLVETYHLAQSKFLAGSDATDITQAALEKRIKTLLVEDNSNHGNAFDKLILSVLQDKGEVVVLPEERMPGSTGIAAIYRY